MDKKTFISLISLCCMSLSFNSLANSPAAMDDTPAAMEEPMTSASEPMSIADDMRPASESEQTTAMEAPATTETQTSGDVLNTTEVMAQPVRQLDFPRRGMTQDKVQNELGRPVEIVPAVGKPPITRWIYDDRVVYFEYSSVVHVVAR